MRKVVCVGDCSCGTLFNFILIYFLTFYNVHKTAFIVIKIFSFKEELGIEM